MLYILEGRVRHEVLNLSHAEPVVAVVSRSSAAECDDTLTIQVAVVRRERRAEYNRSHGGPQPGSDTRAVGLLADGDQGNQGRDVTGTDVGGDQ